MNITLTNLIKQRLTITPIKGMDLIGNILRIFFQNEVESFAAFSRIRNFGVKCSHAGINAPGGPMVTMHREEAKNFMLSISN